MRSANSYMDPAVIRTRQLDRILTERYPGERLADDFHERHLDTHAALRR